MILRKDPDWLYTHIKKNLRLYLSDGKIRIRYSIWLPLDKFHELGFLMWTNKDEYLETSMPLLMKDLIETVNQIGFYTFHLHPDFYSNDDIEGIIDILENE